MKAAMKGNGKGVFNTKPVKGKGKGMFGDSKPKSIEDTTASIIGFGAKAAIGIGVLGAIGGVANTMGTANIGNNGGTPNMPPFNPTPT